MSKPRSSSIARVKRCTRCGGDGPFTRRQCALDGLSAKCKRCQSDDRKAFYDRNKVRILATQKAKYDADPERYREVARRSMAKHAHEHVEAHRERARAYRRQHPEATQSRDRAYYRATRAERLAYERSERRRLNRCQRMARRRALLHCVPSTMTLQAWREILEVFGHRCAYCLASGVSLEREHVVPISRGGSDVPDNVVPACRCCNLTKLNRPVWVMVNQSCAQQNMP